MAELIYVPGGKLVDTDCIVGMNLTITSTITYNLYIYLLLVHLLMVFV